MKLFVTLVVLGGLVAAGVVFGQPYLFPSDWDDATAPYAETVESVRGAEFVEPLTVAPEPSTEFASRLSAQVAATSPRSQPNGVRSGSRPVSSTTQRWLGS